MSLVNAERAERGLARLSIASDLMSVAHRHSAEMASRRRIYHNSSLTSEVRGWRAIGENVGRGSSVSSVHGAFMSSSSHRTHILSARYKQIGTGVVKGSDGYLYVTEVFVDRGSTTTTTTRRVSRSTSTRRVVRDAAPAPRRVRAVVRPKPKPVVKAFVIPRPPDRSVGMLLRLLALDSEIAARMDIAPGPAAD